MDRSARIAEDSRLHPSLTATYWKSEAPRLDLERLAVITQSMLIDIVVTHTAPSFCELIDKAGLSGWAQVDPTLLEDCSRRGK